MLAGHFPESAQAVHPMRLSCFGMRGDCFQPRTAPALLRRRRSAAFGQPGEHLPACGMPEAVRFTTGGCLWRLCRQAPAALWYNNPKHPAQTAGRNRDAQCAGPAPRRFPGGCPPHLKCAGSHPALHPEEDARRLRPLPRRAAIMQKNGSARRWSARSAQGTAHRVHSATERSRKAERSGKREDPL